MSVLGDGTCSRQIFAVSARYNFARNGMNIVTHLGGRKWQPHAKVSHFFCGALQMIIISNRTTAAVQPCPPSMIYAAKSGRQATTTFVHFMCCCFRTHFRAWLEHSNRVQIAIACRHSVHGVSCIHCATVAATHCVCCRPWLLSLAS